MERSPREPTRGRRPWHWRGDAARLWGEAESGEDLRARLAELPGFGEMKVRTLLTLLARQFGVLPPGIQALLAAKGGGEGRDNAMSPD